ncbi:MAG: GDSL-type esterase/lipase family protein [Phycisphaerales bacterium]
MSSPTRSASSATRLTSIAPISPYSAKYGNLFAVDDLAALRKRGVIVYGVWDDHDFGKNDTDGRLPGKENSRRAFLEYHANAGGSAHAGDGKEGVYSSFRRGPVEVFLLDARWFSNNQTLQLLGEPQWQWLLDGLAKSTAKYKLVTTGMVWNDSIRPDKTDYWGHYPKERQRLFDAIRTEKIPGVILVGGDVHRSRAFRTHPFDPTSFTRDPRPQALAYTLHEWTSSPLGNTVHEAWNVPGQTLVWDEGNPHAFLSVKADAKSITATWIDYTGRQLFREQVNAEELTVPPTGEPCKPTPAAVAASRGPDWEKRHDGIVAAFAPAPTPSADRHVPPQPNAGRLVFLGDSITEAWSNAGEADWQRRFLPRGGVNAGIGGDRTQHVLWRLDHGLLDAMRTSKTKLVVLMIGTNNSNGGDHNAAEIAEGVTQIVDRLTTQAGDTKVLLLGVFPRSPKVDFQRRKVAEINRLISVLDKGRSGRIVYLDIGEKFLGEKKWEGDLAQDIMPDYLHLSPKAYTIWADAVEPKIAEMLGEK